MKDQILSISIGKNAYPKENDKKNEDNKCFYDSKENPVVEKLLIGNHQVNQKDYLKYHIIKTSTFRH